jgi:hypothetical protein
MNTRLLTFCECLERVVGVEAVAAEWEHRLAGEWPWARSMLRATNRLAGCYPKMTGGSDSPAQYRIVWRDEAADRYVGSRLGGSDRIDLRRTDLVVYELDRHELARRVASAIGLVFDFVRLEEPADTCRIGAFNPLGADEAWVYFAVPPGPRELAAVVAGLAVRHREPFVLLTPTRSMWRAHHETLRREGATAALDEIIEADDAGRFQATTAAARLFGRLCPSSAADAAPTFRHTGKTRLLVYSGHTTSVIERKGCKYIAHLLANPGVPHHAGDVLAAANNKPELAALARDGGQTALDSLGRADLKRRGQSLLRELDDARRRDDEQAEVRIETEIAAVEAELGRAKGKGGRDRKIGSVAERNRKAVGNAIEAALADIKAVHQPLWRHLESSIDLGIFLRYMPPEPIHWQF